MGAARPRRGRESAPSARRLSTHIAAGQPSLPGTTFIRSGRSACSSRTAPLHLHRLEIGIAGNHQMPDQRLPECHARLPPVRLGKQRSSGCRSTSASPS